MAEAEELVYEAEELVYESAEQVAKVAKQIVEAEDQVAVSSSAADLTKTIVAPAPNFDSDIDHYDLNPGIKPVKSLPPDDGDENKAA